MFLGYTGRSENIPLRALPALTVGLQLVDIPSQFVKLNASRLVLGLANGWTGSHEKAPSLVPMNKTKALLIWPSDLREAYTKLQNTGILRLQVICECCPTSLFSFVRENPPRVHVLGYRRRRPRGRC